MHHIQGIASNPGHPDLGTAQLRALARPGQRTTSGPGAGMMATALTQQTRPLYTDRDARAEARTKGRIHGDGTAPHRLPETQVPPPLPPPSPRPIMPEPSPRPPPPLPQVHGRGVLTRSQTGEGR